MTNVGFITYMWLIVQMIIIIATFICIQKPSNFCATLAHDHYSYIAHIPYSSLCKDVGV